MVNFQQDDTQDSQEFPASEDLHQIQSPEASQEPGNTQDTQESQETVDSQETESTCRAGM